MGWMFSAISADPQLQKFTTLDRAKRDELASSAAQVFQRLIFVDCRKEAVAALKAEGDDSLQQSFGQLGQSAVQEMFQSPEAQAELESLGKGFDDQKVKDLMREAGIAVKDDKK
jgi:hypothetical protein